MKISVVVPTRNDSEVFEALESVLDQEYGDFEVVVVDGSDGGQREDLEDFCQEHENVNYLHESERRSSLSEELLEETSRREVSDSESVRGLNGARNFGVENSNGEGVALLDADCVATEGWLENLAGALEEDDVVECKVTYQGREKNCPMDRVIENYGRNFRFLGAGLSFRREVWEEERFDERLHQLRNDTAFGFEAVENGFSYGFCEEVEVLHRAGRFSPLQFVTERLRFVYEPLFFKEYREHERFEDNVDHLGRLIYPKEGAYLAALLAAALLPFNYASVPLLMGLGELVYLHREEGKRDLDICPKDLLLLFFLVPLALAAKRTAIWKGALKYRTLVM